MLDAKPSPPRDPSMGWKSLGGSHTIYIKEADDVPNQTQQRTCISLISLGIDERSGSTRGGVFVSEHDTQRLASP